ncbi:MAG TPA: sulfotransferase domain-containing protein [Solirubrobacteraceae bacterium]|nr:sulfotransferase domain-containing protein [Solirubrobacteraceae bacterium]
MQTAKDVLDFIVIGAQKSGTTSLFEYLRLHPEITLPAGKEAPYFSHDGIVELGWGTYMRKLALVDPARKWGTVTTHYMAGGVYQSAIDNLAAGEYDERTVPERIRARLPDVRLIAILRDPVQRARSHHRMQAMEGLERRSFSDAIDRLLRPEMLERARRSPEESTGYVVWGEYGRILGGYLDVFPREQLLVTFTEELERDPAGVLARIERFIGVREDFEPPNIGTRYRQGASERKIPWLGPTTRLSPQGVQRALTGDARARAVWHMIPQAAQRRIRHPYERLAFRIALWNRRAGAETNGASACEPDEDAVERLREHFAHDAQRLSARLGVSPPWLTAAGTSPGP